MTYKFIVSHHPAGAGTAESDCWAGGVRWEHYHLRVLCMCEKRDEHSSFTAGGAMLGSHAQSKMFSLAELVF